MESAFKFKVGDRVVSEGRYGNIHFIDVNKRKYHYKIRWDDSSYGDCSEGQLTKTDIQKPKTEDEIKDDIIKDFVLKFTAPSHAYKNCSDEYRENGIYATFHEENPRCQRCGIIDLLRAGNLPEWYRLEVIFDRDGKEQADFEAREKAEYERLKKKFG